MKRAPFITTTALLLIAFASLLLGSVWFAPPAAAQGDATAIFGGPTLPPTWTPTPDRPPTGTPRPIPTREPSPTPTLTAAPYPTLPPPPAQARLGGMTLVWQSYNGCGPAALTMLLLYHGWDGTRDICNRALRPNGDDVSVRSTQMIAFVEAEGFRGVERTGGTLEMLKQLLNAGYPILVENVDGPGGEWWGHNRVIMGYDDARAEVYTFDSVLGSGSDGRGRPIDYVEFDQLWQPFNRTYLVVYLPEQQGEIERILGDQWNATYNAEWTLIQADRELARDQRNSFSWFNLGSAHMRLGSFLEAAQAFDRAQELGLPWRMLWYQFGPFEAYLYLERYQDVIALGSQVLNTTAGVEEVYYYMGEAYAALGDAEEARRSYQQALSRNPSYTEAGLALERLNMGVMRSGH